MSWMNPSRISSIVFLKAFLNYEYIFNGYFMDVGVGEFVYFISVKDQAVLVHETVDRGLP